MPSSDSGSNLTGFFLASTSTKPKIKKSKRRDIQELKAVFRVLFQNSRRWLCLPEITEKTGISPGLTDLSIEVLHEKGWLQFRTTMNGRVYALRNSSYRLGKSMEEFYELLLRSCQRADE